MAAVGIIAAMAWIPAHTSSATDMQARVAAQRAIEGVYWRHRVWPAADSSPKPSLDQVLPEIALRAKVENYLLESDALERLWGRPIRSEDLRDEVARMTASTRAPDVLREILAALGDDPSVVAECLARPLLADLWIRRAYALDPRWHLSLKKAIEESLARGMSVATARETGGDYRETVWLLGEGRPSRGGTRSNRGREIRLDSGTWRREVARLRARFHLESPAEDLPLKVFTEVQEDDERFYVQAVLEKDSSRLRLATASWRKRPFDAWWAETKAALVEGRRFDRAPLPGDELAGSTAGTPPLSAAITSTCLNNTWASVSASGAPTPREAHTVVWTGVEMIVWGGYDANSNLDTDTGGRYDPATDSWAPTSTIGAPDPRDTHTAVWTGTKMVVWGGGNEVFVPKSSGGRYDPTANSWSPTSMTGAPTAREYHAAIWAGFSARMIVWGGWDGNRDLATGGRYDPAADTWSTTAKSGAPDARDSHTAVWNGTNMVVWGGEDDSAVTLNTGGRYDPAANAWSATSIVGAPVGRQNHTAVWTGSNARMIVWGGYDGFNDLDTGGSYDPNSDMWTPTSTTGAPAARDQHTAVWTNADAEMIVWGGQDDLVVQLNSGGRYKPATDAWTTMSTSGAPAGRRFHTATWTDSVMVVWGGWDGADLDSGGRYCVSVCTSPPPTGIPSVSVSMEMGGERISWSTAEGATGYDLVRGGLNSLRSTGGDFTTSTQLCLTDDQMTLSYVDPALPAGGEGLWYLVRAVSCGGAGSYDGPGAQVGSRDAEISLSPNGCP